MKGSRVFIPSVDYLPRSAQRALCADLVEANADIPRFDVGVREAVYGPGVGDLADLLNKLDREEVVIIPRVADLDFLPPVKGLGRGASFLQRLGDLVAGSAFVVEATSGLRSTDVSAWREHRQKTHGIITKRRSMTSERASEVSMERWKNAPPGVVALWKGYEGTGLFMRVRDHWRNVDDFPTAELAIKHAPEEAGALRDCKRRTWERIFRGRHAADAGEASRKKTRPVRKKKARKRSAKNRGSHRQT